MRTDIKTIWLADDNEDDCEVFSDALTEYANPPQLTYLKNDQDVVTRLKAHRQLPDLVFLDVNVPFKGGMEALKEIKQDDELRLLPVIVLSTVAYVPMIDIAYQLGARLFVKKTRNYHEFKVMLDEIFAMNLRVAAGNKTNEFILRSE